MLLYCHKKGVGMDRYELYREALLSYRSSMSKEEYEKTMNVLYQGLFLPRFGHAPNDITALVLALPIIQIVMFGIPCHQVQTNRSKIEGFLDRLPMKAVEYIFGGNDLFRIIRRFEVQYRFITSITSPQQAY